MSSVASFQNEKRAVITWISAILSTEPLPPAHPIGPWLASGVLLCRLCVALGGEFAIPQIAPEDAPKWKLAKNIEFACMALRDFGVKSLLLPRNGDFSGLAQGESRLVRMLCDVARTATEKKWTNVPFSAGLFPDEKSNLPVLSSVEQKRLSLALRSLDQQVSRRVSRVGRVSSNAALATADTSTDRAMSADEKIVWTRGMVRLQALIRGVLARERVKEVRRAAAFRDRVAKEILETERDYVGGLTWVREHYLKPMQEHPKIVTPEQVNAIFSRHFETLLGLSIALLADLELRMCDWTHSSHLGDIFLKIVDFLKIYTLFIENFDLSMSTRNQLDKSSKYRHLIKKCDLADKTRRGLASYLIMPVQRLPRYLMLLTELAKHTNADHADAPLLAQAVERVQHVADYVNEQKRSAEQLTLLHALQRLLKPGKHWQPFAVRGRSVTKLSKAMEAGAPRGVALLDDLVMVMKGNVDALIKTIEGNDTSRFGAVRPGAAMPSSDSVLCDVLLVTQTRTVDLLASDEEGATECDVVLTTLSGDTLATLTLDSVAARDTWIQTFRDTKRALIERAAFLETVRNNTAQTTNAEAPAPDTPAEPKRRRRLSVKWGRKDKERPQMDKSETLFTGSEANDMMSTLRVRRRRVSGDLTSLVAATTRLDQATQQMHTLRQQVTSVEVQLLHDDQRSSKKERISKRQRQALNTLLQSLRADLTQAIANVDVLAAHVAQMEEMTGHTVADAQGARETATQAKRESLARNLSRRRSAEVVRPAAMNVVSDAAENAAVPQDQPRRLSRTMRRSNLSGALQTGMSGTGGTEMSSCESDAIATVESVFAQTK